ncbi:MULTISPECIES: TRAP transporter small permease [unclassified Leisingera]|uniref:TRAP transporter small permease n=1 Tax=unclassified Leisingera TaxID=2614906 RepID=UPI00057F50AA|nr:MULTISPECIES: TRAP transporter small permease [unclassified Leisingera]KIC28103.1 C4-dicarboxylate ABC transporter permease [Leisingera sp. ANG-M6]KIC29732.1 C4-dicarboxylate ABC transporter permease [Leisingera sp. ANG-S5]
MAQNTPETSAYGSALPGIAGMIDTWVSRIEAFLLAAAVMLMAMNTMSNVVGRYFFQQSLFFSEELNRVLIILVTFSGIGYAARHGRHIRMSAVFDALPAALRKKMMIVIALVTAAVMYALFWFSIDYVFFNVAPKGRVLPALGIPVYWSYLLVPLGFFIAGTQYALTALKNLSGTGTYLSTHVREGYGQDEIEL